MDHTKESERIESSRGKGRCGRRENGREEKYRKWKETGKEGKAGRRGSDVRIRRRRWCRCVEEILCQYPVHARTRFQGGIREDTRSR